MRNQQLDGTDAFVVFDLDDVETSVGVTRAAPKILADGATLLARSQTYQFASFERQMGGASAGINAKPDVRPEAVARFVDDVRPLTESSAFLTEAAKGLQPVDLMALREADGRSAIYWEHGARLRGLGAAVAAATAGGLDGRRVAIEGLDAVGLHIATEVAARGATVVAVSTPDGACAEPTGLGAEALASAWTEHGPGLVERLGSPVDSIFAADSDVLFVGSKAGVIDHEIAAGLDVGVVVPSGPVPVTAKALAALRREHVVVLPDFVSTAGALFAMFPAEGADIEGIRAEAESAVTEVLRDVLDHDDGPLLGACYRAEAYLRTWREDLPFGRPLA